MQRIPDAGRAAALVLELSSGTAIRHGEAVELPLREFRLLAALARRVGQPVASTELIEAVWPEEPWTPKEVLYVLVSKLRRLIDGPTKFGQNIRNRRGFGYMLDLDPSEVVVIDSGTQESLEDRVIWLDEPGDGATDAHAPQTPDAPDPGGQEPGEVAVKETPRATSHPRGLRLAGIAALVLILLAGSWSAGYLLSKVSRSESRDETKGAEGDEDSGVTAPPHQPKDRDYESDNAGRNRKADRKENPPPRTNEEQRVVGTAGGSGTPAGNLTSQDRKPQGSRKGSKKQPSEPALPPAPTRYLYHLVNEKTGDHFVTVDGNTTSEYEAMGYEGGAIARVYTYQEEGTKAISTNHGTAYIFVSSSPPTEPSSRAVTLWYSTNDDGDFFYTTSESEGKQSGWHGSVIGYVRSL